jgi:hypothetical protein
MAAKARDIYGLTNEEAMKLTPEQVSFLEDNAKRVAEQLYLSSPELQQQLRDKLAPVTRSVRAQLAGGAAPAPGPPPA